MALPPDSKEPSLKEKDLFKKSQNISWNSSATQASRVETRSRQEQWKAAGALLASVAMLITLTFYEARLGEYAHRLTLRVRHSLISV